MKKVLSILLIIVLMLGMLVGLTACNDEDDEDIYDEDIYDEDVYDEDRDVWVDSGVLERAEETTEETREKIRIENAKEDLGRAIADITAYFFNDYISDETLVLFNYLTKSKLEEGFLYEEKINKYNQETGEGVMEDSEGFKSSFTLKEQSPTQIEILKFEAMD